jgi:hypothetical protein
MMAPRAPPAPGWTHLIVASNQHQTKIRRDEANATCHLRADLATSLPMTCFESNGGAGGFGGGALTSRSMYKDLDKSNRAVVPAACCGYASGRRTNASQCV